MDKHYVYIYLDPFKPGKWQYEDITFDYKPFYVGIGVGRRWKEHLSKYNLENDINKIKNKKIKNILNKNENPKIIKIYENLSHQKAKEKEIDVISTFGRIINKSGILTNITPGGDMTSANSLGKNNIHSKQIFQYDLQGNFIKKWECSRDFGRNINKYASNISNCCLGRADSAYGYVWFYEYKGEKIESYIEYNRFRDRPEIYKKVYVFNTENDLIQTFDSVKFTAVFFNIQPTVIGKHARNGCKYRGLYFSYNKNFRIPKQKVWTYNGVNYLKKTELYLKNNITKGAAEWKQRRGEIKINFI